MKRLAAIIILLLISASVAFGQGNVKMVPFQVSLANSTAYEASRVVKATSGTVYHIMGYNSGSAQFIQVHNATSLPADTAVPLFVGTAAATSNFDFEFTMTGLPCSTGIVICNSTTGPTKTIGTANCWFVVLYR
jgi:hypothetical protein